MTGQIWANIVALCYLKGFDKNTYIHAHGSNSEGDPCRVQMTPHHDSLQTRITPKIATAIKYLIYKYSTFLHNIVIRALPNATALEWS